MNQNDLNQERDQSRNVMISAWRKNKNSEQLEPLEQQVVNIIKDHPEYQAAFEQEEHLSIDYPMEPTINPFLHIGLHLTILDQIKIDQPNGIRDIFQTLVEQVGNSHEAEHMMMQVLSVALEAVISDPSSNADQIYLAGLQELLR